MSMKWMSTDDIREQFLIFFEKKGHKRFPSDSLVPEGDPTLLFTGAGMNQFKPYFLGTKKGLRRAASSQRCLRAGDLDEVGHTPTHHTFFEMLGNFSFGDYFKEEAILWGWEFLTGTLGIPPDRLAVSVYEKDEEAYEIWADKIKAPKKRIFKFGPKENFWPSNVQTEGPNGPCGPCSEIFYDRDPKNQSTKYDERRFFEIWNLVFTQYERMEDGSLRDLPAKNIDTGMGLERIASVLQGAKTNFDIDIFQPIVKHILDSTEGRRGEELKEKRAWVNRIADHARAVTFAVLDGVIPSNKERGYVVRTLIRRASFSARTLGIKTPFLFKTVPVVAQTLRGPYPDVWESRERISRVILNEEESFEKTLEQGLTMEEDLLERLYREGKKTLPGKDIFYLYDTLGLPLDLIRYAAEQKKIALDDAGFKKELARQRERSKRGSRMKGEVFGGDVAKQAQLDFKTTFVGYETCHLENAEVVAILKEGERVKEAKEGEAVEIFLNKTPFYGEQGGQIGDTGTLFSETLSVRIEDAQHLGETLVHYGKVEKGCLKEGDRITARVDEARRRETMKNHTATHLLHAVLRETLGPHATQAGSYVGPDRLRFDFMHPKPLTSDEIRRVEERVNSCIDRDDTAQPREMSREESRKEGAIAFFGEKYGEQVRVLTISDYSKELCGGTHVSKTGTIDFFWIVSEGSIGSGIRRIEALTGKEAYRKGEAYEESIEKIARTLNVIRGRSIGSDTRRLKTLKGSEAYRRAKSYETIMKKIAQCLKVPEERIFETVRNLKERLKHTPVPAGEPFEKGGKEFFNRMGEAVLKAVEQLRERAKEEEKKRQSSKESRMRDSVAEIRKRGEDISGIYFVPYEVRDYSKEEIPTLLDLYRRQQDGKWNTFFYTVDDDGKLFYVTGSDGTISARDISKVLNEVTGSKGGGSERIAKGGGGDPEEVPRAVDAVKKWIAENSQ